MYTMDPGLVAKAVDRMSIIKDELDTRARFEAGVKLFWHATEFIVQTRFWRKSGEAFLYNLRAIARPGTTPDMPRKVPEHEIDTDRGSPAT
jgi:hypothetical protein